MTSEPGFTPAHVERTGSFTLALPVERALSFFTPEGERAWVDGWTPEYLHPTRPALGPGVVFRTGHNHEDTLWLVLQYEPARALVEYARFSPGSRLGTVHVQCFADGAAATRVVVTYVLTALSPRGNALLEALTDNAYTAMLEAWRCAIADVSGRDGPDKRPRPRPRAAGQS